MKKRNKNKLLSTYTVVSTKTALLFNNITEKAAVSVTA
jgi:hypothetical protein